MKKFVRNLLLAAFVLLGAVPVFLTACGGGAKHTLKFDAGEGIDIPDIVASAGDPITPPTDPEKTGFEFAGWYLSEDGSGEKQSLPTVMPDEDVVYYGKWAALPQITLSLGGGSLTEGETLFLKAGSDLYTFMQQYVPQKDGVKFGAWKLGDRFLSEDDTMPEDGVTLTAAWKQPVKVTLYTLDFATYDEYIAGDVQTAYAYAGETFDAEAIVPEHYTLNAEKTGKLTVEEGANELGVYADPVYTRYTDVFESTDYLYELETETGALYLDRIGMESGRKKSNAYNGETGIFSFETDSDFVLSGKIVGEKFYYFRDTLEKTFPDYFGTEATLQIVSPQEVIYTPAGGNAVEGSYSVDVETGRYIFTPASGDPFEFVLIEDAGVVSFRMSDGVEGWYAYGGELVMGGWSLLHFDGFGVALNVDDEGTEIEFDYIAGANGIVDLPELGRIQLTDSEQEDIGGHEIKGTFINSDGYEGVYTYVQGYNTHTLTLDGFGGALYHSEGNGFPEPVDTAGHYTIGKDEPWLIYGYNSALGIYLIGEYSGVNEWLVFTDSQNTSTKYLLSESTDEEGTALTFAPYSESDYSVAPGVYPVTNSIVYKGTAYTVDDTHKAFLYFYNTVESSQEADLWYGTYEEGYEGYVYERILKGSWFEWGNNLYNDDLDYSGGMNFSDMTEEGTFEYIDEDYEGEVEQYVFFSDDAVGTLIIDGAGVARFTPAGGEAVVVDYEEIAIGLLSILSFTFPESVPESVSSLYAVYSDIYLLEPQGVTKIYDLHAENCKMLQIALPDGTEDGSVVLVVTQDMAFLGCLFVYEDDSELLEFVFAGTTAPVDGSENEYTFTWDDSIYYDELDYIEDADYIVAAFAEFRYQELQDGTFLYYDGYEFSLTDGGNSFVSDGYGSATLTLNGTQIQGYYTVEYNVITFAVADSDEEYTIAVTGDGFTVVDFETETGLLYGYYYSAALSEDGLPEGILSATLFLDGAGGFVYETAEYSQEDYDYTIVTEEGSYRYVGRGQSSAGAATLVIELTFAEDDVREARIIIYDYFGDGNLYGFFVIRNGALTGEYDAYTDDGAELGYLLGGDGYIEESAIFFGEDRNGEFNYKGYMARGTIEDIYYDQAPQFTADPDGDVVVFVTYDGDDMLQYVFDISDEVTEDGVAKVYYRDKFYGAVGEYKVVGGTTGNYLYLDGHSKATLYNAENQATANGTYDFVPGMEDAYAFKSSNLNFIFQPSATIYGGTILYIYTVYGEKEDVVCINDDWSILSMDGFGGAAYVDRYGTTYTGEYYQVIENEQVYCLKVENSTQRIYYELNKDGTFALCTGDFLVRDGVLYSYFGAEETIKIPDEVTEIAEGAFILSGAHNVKHIDFNKVTKIADRAFYGGATSVEEIVSNSILEIGASAFESVWSITRVELPNATKIGERAFYACAGLEEVKLGKIASIGAYAFSRNIALYDTPLTLDLTAVESFDALNVDLAAFLAFRGVWGIVNETMMVEGSKILVGGDLASLNAAAKLFKGKTASIKYHDMAQGDKEGPVDVDLSGLLTLVSSGEAQIDPYYSLAADTVFLFEDGVLTEYTKGSYSYEGGKTHPYFVKDGNVIVYAYNAGNGLYEQEVRFASGADTFTLGSVTAVKKGAPETVTVQVSGKNVVITYTASVSTGFSVSVTLAVTAVTYDGAPAENVVFDSYYGALKFNANGHGFEATLEDGTFTVTDLGVQVVLTDKTFDTIYFRITLGVADDGSISLVKFEVNNYVSSNPDYFTEAYSSDIEEGEEPNTWLYSSFSYEDYSYTTYQLQVTEQGGEYTLTVTVVPEA